MTYTSCEDSDKNPTIQGNVAPFVKFESSSQVFDLADPTSGISGTFFSEAPELIESHEVFVGLQNNANSVVFESVVVITEFPFEFNLTIGEVENILGLDPGTVLPGELVLLNNITTSTSGVVLSIDEVALSGETVSVAQQQGYSVTASVSCPFVYEDIPEGTYTVNELGFGGFFNETLATRTIELGPGPNQVTIIEGEFPVEGSDPLILTSLGLNFAPFSGNEHVFILRAQ